MHKICKKYTKLYKELDREKKSKRTFNLNDEERKEFTIKIKKYFNHFEKLVELIENKYHDNIIRIILDFVEQNHVLYSKY